MVYPREQRTTNIGPDGRRPKIDWTDKTVIVTSGAGFLGRHVVAKLRERMGGSVGRPVCHGTGRPATAGEIIIPRSADYDLRHWDAIQQLFADRGSRIVGLLRFIWPATSVALGTTARSRASSSTTMP